MAERFPLATAFHSNGSASLPPSGFPLKYFSAAANSSLPLGSAGDATGLADADVARGACVALADLTGPRSSVRDSVTGLVLTGAGELGAEEAVASLDAAGTGATPAGGTLSVAFDCGGGAAGAAGTDRAGADCWPFENHAVPRHAM